MKLLRIGKVFLSIFFFFIFLSFIYSFLINLEYTDATIIKKISLNELVEKADQIFVGKVTEINSFWDTRHEKIWTTVSFSVIQTIKGKSAENITVKLLGGQIKEENIESKVDGMPEFKIGEEGLIFLKDQPGLYCPIVGWYQGQFKIQKDTETGQYIVDDNEGQVITRFLKKEKRLLKKSDGKLLLNDFVEEIKTLMNVSKIRNKDNHNGF
jgi:hypothetical protein